MGVALEATRVRPKRTSLTAMRQRLHAVRVRPKLRASLTAMRQRLHAVRVRPIRASLTAMRQRLRAVRVRSEPLERLNFDGDASAVAACGAMSAGSANCCTTDARPRCGSGLKNSRLSSSTRGGRSCFPVMGVDVVEGVFEHSGERVLLDARHLDRDRRCCHTREHSEAGRTGEGRQTT